MQRRDVSPELTTASEPSSMASEEVPAGGGREEDEDMAEASAAASTKPAGGRRSQRQTTGTSAMAPPPPRNRHRRRRPPTQRGGNAARDIVLLNVGGTVFTTSAATLTSDSSYFRAMFSDRWAASADEEGGEADCGIDDDVVGGGGEFGYGGGGGGAAAGPSAADVGIHRGSDSENGYGSFGGGHPPCPVCHPHQHYQDPFFPRPDPIFIDQDARPFSHLLTYMRGGGINLLESDVPLARQVLLQAQYFGVDGLLRAVRARAYRHNHPNFNGTDDEANTKFEGRYGGLDAAIADGVLPEAYFRPMPDHVVINAGGTTFETSKRTLTERSPYFESLFKRSPRERTYFLDVDPGAFGILLKYMRHAEFDLPRRDVALFRCVLALAQRFEIRGFIEYVKARTYAIQSGHDPREWLTFLDRHHHPIEDSDNADAFNENYEGVDEAFVTGILPDGFFEKRET